MKQIFISLLCGISLSLFSQPSFKLFFAHTTNEVAPNTTLQITSKPLDETKVTLDILNTSSLQTHVYDVKRYDIIVNSIGNDDAALPYFCFGSLCYPNNELISTLSLTLNPGQNSKSVGSGFDSAYFSLNMDLLEATVRGLSEIKYTIFNTQNPNDSIQVTARYNDPQFVGITRQNAMQTSMQFHPNPAKDLVSLRINSAAASDANLQILDVSGKEVFVQKNTLQVGENTLNLNVSNIAPGLYYLKVQNQTSVISRKFVIE